MIVLVLSVLRIIGIANSALWFGATLLFLICIRSVFQSEAMTDLIPVPFSEAAMHILLKNYLSVIFLCSCLAICQLWVIRWYQGRPIFYLRIYLLVILVVLSAILKWGLFPSMQEQHIKAYQKTATAEERQKGARSYRTWKTGFYFIHLIILGGSLSHLLHVTQGDNRYRELGVQQFRG